MYQTGEASGFISLSGTSVKLSIFSLEVPSHNNCGFHMLPCRFQIVSRKFKCFHFHTVHLRVALQVPGSTQHPARARTEPRSVRPNGKSYPQTCAVSTNQLFIYTCTVHVCLLTITNNWGCTKKPPGRAEHVMLNQDAYLSHPVYRGLCCQEVMNGKRLLSKV